VGDQTPAKAAVPVTLDAWSPWDGNPADFDQRKASLKEAQPHITLNWTGTGFATYLDKVTAAVASGTPHDLTYLDNQHQGFFGKNKLVVDQGPFGKRDKDFKVEAIDPKALALYTYEGAVLGYPWSLTTGQVFFNKALFAAAGRPTPDTLYRAGNWTWAAMLEAAQALTRANPDGTFQQLGMAHTNASLWQLLIQSNGSDLYDDFRKPKKSRLDEPAAVQALEWLQDAIVKHRVAWRVPEATGLGMNARVAFSLGKIAMHSDYGTPTPANTTLGPIMDQLGWVPAPKGPAAGGKPTTDLTTEAQGIMKASNKQDAGWLYAKWFQKDWQRVKLLEKLSPRVASRADLQDVARAALPAPQDLWFEMVKMGQARPVFPDRGKTDGEILNPQLNAVWRGEATPRAAAMTAAKQLNDYFAANPQ